MSGTNAEQAAWAELDRLTAGSPGKLWRWSIPADPERDSDLILAAGLKAVAAERDAAALLLDQYAGIIFAHLSQPGMEGGLALSESRLKPYLGAMYTQSKAIK